MIEKDANIYIAGQRGMVGASIWRNLLEKGYSNLIGKTSTQLDLRNQNDVKPFLILKSLMLLLMRQQGWEVF